MWDGQGWKKLITDEGHKIWYSGEHSKHQSGWHSLYGKKLLVVSSGALPSSTDLFPSGSLRSHTITVIQVSAPTSDQEDEEVEEFSTSSLIASQQTPKKDILVVQGDWNAKYALAHTNTRQGQ